MTFNNKREIKLRIKWYIQQQKVIFVFLKYRGKERTKELNIIKSFDIIRFHPRKTLREASRFRRLETHRSKISSKSNLQSVKLQSVWSVALICKWLITVTVSLVYCENGPRKVCTENYSSGASISKTVRLAKTLIYKPQMPQWRSTCQCFLGFSMLLTSTSLHIKNTSCSTISLPEHKVCVLITSLTACSYSLASFDSPCCSNRQITVTCCPLHR